MSEKGFFITLEGVEGTGKSTAIKWFEKWFDTQGIDYVITREPGGTQIAEAIRQLLLAPYSEPMCADTELLLLFAGRAQHITHLIRPALAAGKWVLSDRFTDASFAYQGGGRGLSEQRIAELAHWVQGDFQPDLTLLFDAPLAITLERISKRKKDRIEMEKIDFFERVRNSYLKLAAAHSNRYQLVHAGLPLNRVHKQLQEIMHKINEH